MGLWTSSQPSSYLKIQIKWEPEFLALLHFDIRWWFFTALIESSHSWIFPRAKPIFNDGFSVDTFITSPNSFTCRRNLQVTVLRLEYVYNLIFYKSQHYDQTIFVSEFLLTMKILLKITQKQNLWAASFEEVS